MAPSRWDDEEEESTPPSSPPAPVAAVRRGKFDDEEDDSDVIDSWDKEEDSETERAKAAAAAAAKARAEAEAAKNKKSKSQRIEERRMENMRRRQEEEDEMSSEEEEDEAAKRERLRRTEKDADLKHAQDLFGDVGISKNRSAPTPVTLTTDPKDPTKTVELSSLQIFNPQTREQFVQLRDTLAPLIAGSNVKKAQYPSFATEFVKQMVKDLPSDQIKKIASGLTTISNEKLKEEKAADKGSKKTKAAKTKTSLNASRDAAARADTTAYEDGLDEDDFM